MLDKIGKIANYAKDRHKQQCSCRTYSTKQPPRHKSVSVSTGSRKVRHPADRQSRIQAKYKEVEITSDVGFSSLAANISQIHAYLVQIVKRRPVKLAKFYSKII